MKLGFGLWLSHARAPAEGGGGDEYVAQAITISAGSSVERGAALTGVSDGPTGFISFWVRPTPEAVGVDFVKTAGGNFEAQIEGTPDIEFRSYLTDEFGTGFSQLHSTGPIIDWAAWNHVLYAWDMGHAAGSRRWAVYANDVLTDIEPNDEFSDDGPAFDVAYTANNFYVLMPPPGGGGALSYADYGMWLGSSIVEADGTITEVNRRKFISATGKPVDPTNWPALPVVKFSGDETTFLTNQGTGGAFSLVSGTIEDAATSPSD